MDSRNMVIFGGNLGRDPEFKTTQHGKSLCTFSMANTKKWKDNQGNEQKKTTWVDVTLWENIATGFTARKGDEALIVGELKQEQWQDNQGNARSKLSITGRVAIVTPKQPQQPAQQPQQQYQQPSQPQQNQQQAPWHQPQQQGPPPQAPPPVDNDLPF